MDKYKELIELLRGYSTGKQCQKCRREKDPLCMVNFMAEAADAIEELLQNIENAPIGWIPVFVLEENYSDINDCFVPQDWKVLAKPYNEERKNE